MKFFLSVFIIAVSLLVMSGGTDAHARIRHVMANSSEIFARLAPPANIQPGDFVAD
ncbi:hypothetical protein [Paraburkholderia acidisoli]|uniref:Uncharacterized protein n=1 Tax=Paraburkholderia acidisoli TaxID=2571748 RepID=A0A7Z2GP06_9BURK|nr:hypothetical protein [Paraburkholderia acidisoli]QGZ65069.1 hypothetical protein FAZ98_25110 [Paraburkholderia acidisoli]